MAMGHVLAVADDRQLLTEDAQDAQAEQDESSVDLQASMTEAADTGLLEQGEDEIVASLECHTTVECTDIGHGAAARECYFSAGCRGVQDAKQARDAADALLL